MVLAGPTTLCGGGANFASHGARPWGGETAKFGTKPAPPGAGAQGRDELCVVRLLDWMANRQGRVTQIVKALSMDRIFRRGDRQVRSLRPMR